MVGWSENLSLGGSAPRKRNSIATPAHQSISVVGSCIPVFFLPNKKVNLRWFLWRPLEYSLKMNNMSLLNFDPPQCWIVIVLPWLEYDYIRLLILTGPQFIFRHSTWEEEMKWGNVKSQEKTTLAAPFLTIALRSVMAGHQNKDLMILYSSYLWVRICNLTEIYDISFCCNAVVLH